MPTTVADSQSGECGVGHREVARRRSRSTCTRVLSVSESAAHPVNGRVVQWTVICVDDRSRESDILWYLI